ncbi:hypothetical protein JXB41_03410 [Candidatus Woesearchaeota archaeon]|nr:hypothetical protein [Candidatus Woesearchaeota archaeon]
MGNFCFKIKEQPAAFTKPEKAIIPAFTIATAFIWKDVILDVIEMFVPQGKDIYYKLLAATLSTLLIVVIVFIILQTESTAENYFDKIKNKNKKI